jgi:hypothetical protein
MGLVISIFLSRIILGALCELGANLHFNAFALTGRACRLTGLDLGFGGDQLFGFFEKLVA